MWLLTHSSSLGTTVCSLALAGACSHCEPLCTNFSLLEWDGLPKWLSGKESTSVTQETPSLILGWGDNSGEGMATQAQSSYWRNIPMDREARQAGPLTYQAVRTAEVT